VIVASLEKRLSDTEKKFSELLSAVGMSTGKTPKDALEVLALFVSQVKVCLCYAFNNDWY
jgi:hypothetical protein